MLYKNLKTLDKLYWYNYSSLMQSEFIKLNESIEQQGNTKRLSLLKKANQFNIDFYTQIKKDILNNTSKKEFLEQNSFSLNIKEAPHRFNYLARDWGEDKTYDEINDIILFIKKKIKKLQITNTNKALFIGCGCGRYAVDLANQYNSVKAFDKSFPMIWSIHNLIKLKELTIYLKDSRNSKNINDTVQAKVIKISEKQLKIIKNKVNFFVGNVINMPLKEKSINHIYSIYFTDVLPLKILFKEIDRVLTNNGLFIHFGPLEYFFTNEKEMLTTEEIKSFFKSNGYSIIADDFLPTKHLFSENSLRYRVYDNWFFIAQKTMINLNKIDLDSTFEIAKNVKLEKIDIFENNCTSIEKYQISFKDKTYSLPQIIYDLLKTNNKKTTLKDSIRKIYLKNNIEKGKDDEVVILKIMNDLCKSNFITKI